MQVWAVLAISFALIALPAAAQSPQFSTGDFHGRDAYFLQNGKIRVAALRGAGHIGEIRFLSDDPKLAVNPMRVPHFQTIEPWEYDPAKHDAVYGGGTAKILQSGYMGHLINFPTFGGPSEAEAEQGLGNHGEALSQEWKLLSHQADDQTVSIVYEAELPIQRYKVGRRLTVNRGESVLYIEEWAENLLGFDRPAMWVQHVTFGDPFVEAGKTTLDMSATQGEVRRGGEETNSLLPGPVFWPAGRNRDGGATDLRVMQPYDGAGTYVGYLMDPEREEAWFTMYHPDYRVLIGYVWETADFPFMGDWQENGRNKHAPWGGEARARGMELGTTPFGGTMASVVGRGSDFARPNHTWLRAREKRTVRYLAFLAEIPEGFRGVADVQTTGGKIRVVERGTSRRFELESKTPW